MKHRIGFDEDETALARPRARARDVKEWVREAAGLGEDDTVMVAELACSEPGCPPYEVVMAVLGANGQRTQRKLHARLHEVTRAAVHEIWMAEKGKEHE